MGATTSKKVILADPSSYYEEHPDPNLKYDIHPDPYCSDVFIPRNITHVFGYHGLEYEKIDGNWKLTQPIRYFSEPEVHEDLCKKENGKFIYRVF